MGDLVAEHKQPVRKSEHSTETAQLRVVVVGATSLFGRETFRSLSQWEQIELVAAVDSAEIGKNMRELVGGRSASVVVEEKLGPVLDREKYDVLLDFSRSAAGLQHALSAMKRGISVILGGAHLSGPDIRELHVASKEHNVPVLVVPYFSLGAIFLLHLCRHAAEWIPDIEIVDVNPNHKEEQPSVLAKAFAEVVADGWENRRNVPHGYVKSQATKTWKDVPLHKLHIKGSNQHQEIVFGSAGESFTLRYDWNEPSAILEGLRLALSSIRSLSGVTVGLDKLIF